MTTLFYFNSKIKLEKYYGTRALQYGRIAVYIGDLEIHEITLYSSKSQVLPTKTNV